MACYRIIVFGGVALVAGAVLVGPADATAIGERLIFDGCEVGGRGNDIHSVQSHYEADRDRIVVTVRLCSAARTNATYRVYLDHAAPFVGKGAAAANCATTADTMVAHSPGGHQGVGTSRVQGETVRFVVPLAKLHVGKPKDVPLIPLWVTSTLGKVEDRAPNSEAGDGCAHPRATTETLVQARVAVTGIAFLTTYKSSGALDNSPQDAIISADNYCRQEAYAAGLTNVSGIHAWLSNRASSPSSYIGLGFGPIQTADGTTVVASTSDFANCNPNGNQCLLAPIDKDVHGNLPLDTDDTIWTGALPDGTNGAGELSDCNDWTSNSASDTGDGGVSVSTNVGFTFGTQDSCDQMHRLLCVQFQ